MNVSSRLADYRAFIASRATDSGPPKAPALRCGRGLFARNHRPHYTRLRVAGNSSLAAA